MDKYLLFYKTIEYTCITVTKNIHITACCVPMPKDDNYCTYLRCIPHSSLPFKIISFTAEVL